MRPGLLLYPRIPFWVLRKSLETRHFLNSYKLYPRNCLKTALFQSFPKTLPQNLKKTSQDCSLALALKGKPSPCFADELLVDSLVAADS